MILAFAFAFLGEIQAAEVRSTEVVKVTVQKDQWLAQIARKHGRSDYLNVAKENGITNPNHIEPGWVIVFAGTKTAEVAETQKQAVGEAQTANTSCRASDFLFQLGLASWSGKERHGKQTANSETYDMNAFTVAHPSLPFGTMVCIENVYNGRSVTARVNDRIAPTGKRIIGMSHKAALVLDTLHVGLGSVRVTVLATPTLSEQRNTTHAATGTRKATTATRRGTASIDRLATPLVSLPPGPTPGHVEQTNSVALFLMSEVVVTEFGPAHVIDGWNRNRIAPRDAIARLFPDSSADTRTALLQLVVSVKYTAISLLVGDRLPRMLTAEGDLYENVLQAQSSDVALPALCYAYRDEESGSNFLLVRESRSGNWYGEKIPVSPNDTATCLRKRGGTEVER